MPVQVFFFLEHGERYNCYCMYYAYFNVQTPQAVGEL